MFGNVAIIVLVELSTTRRAGRPLSHHSVVDCGLTLLPGTNPDFRQILYKEKQKHPLYNNNEKRNKYKTVRFTSETTTHTVFVIENNSNKNNDNNI